MLTCSVAMTEKEVQRYLEDKEEHPAVLSEVELFSQCCARSAVQNCTKQYSTAKCTTRESSTKEETENLQSEYNQEASFRKGEKVQGTDNSYVVPRKSKLKVPESL